MIITDRIKTELLSEDMLEYTLILPSRPQKTCLWLHGFRERAKDLLEKSPLEKISQKHSIAILIPDVPDTYYLDQPWNNCHTQTFLIKEFLPLTIEKHQLPAAPGHLCIGGNSMGGFGSLLLGCRYPDMFGQIISISGAFIINDILLGNPEVVGTAPGNLKYFQNLFGDLPSLETSWERNPLEAARRALASGTAPSIFLSCGMNDMLYPRNIGIKEQLLAAGAKLTWTEHPGGHNWTSSHPALMSFFRQLTG